MCTRSGAAAASKSTYPTKYDRDSRKVFRSARPASEAVLNVMEMDICGQGARELSRMTL